MIPSIPPDEGCRLEALQNLGILDTPSEERFDRLTRLGQTALETPICLVSLVDEERQWFKSRQGLDATETPRDISFCGHAILQADLFIIEDAARDKRFHDNPLVTGQPHIRFYAGRPLHATDGSRLGTFCVIDRVPRRLSSEQCVVLDDLGVLVERELNIVRAELLDRDSGVTKEQLYDALVRSQEASRAKSDFVATMSHEIRTPLMAILGFAEELQEQQLSQGDQHRARKAIFENGNHLLGVINDILDLSKIEARKMELDVTRIPTMDFLKGIAAASRQATAGDVGFRVEMEGPLPESMLTDATRLRQVLMNLLSNARKFTQQGEVVLGVRPVQVDPECVLEFQVRDTGIGMTLEEQARVFQSFAQACVTTTSRFGGTGLGLTITRSLVKMLGGTVEVFSEPGKGSTFSIVVPVGELSNQAMIEQPEMLAPGSPAPTVLAEDACAGVRVLLAEDNAVNALLIQRFLTRHGAEVKLASDGREAVNRALAARQNGSPYDIILMDVQMPELDGLEATRQLRSQGLEQPILALTANALESDRHDALEAGCDGYVTKPVTRGELVRQVLRSLTPAMV